MKSDSCESWCKSRGEVHIRSLEEVAKVFTSREGRLEKVGVIYGGGGENTGRRDEIGSRSGRRGDEELCSVGCKR